MGPSEQAGQPDNRSWDATVDRLVRDSYKLLIGRALLYTRCYSRDREVALEAAADIVQNVHLKYWRYYADRPYDEGLRILNTILDTTSIDWIRKQLREQGPGGVTSIERGGPPNDDGTLGAIEIPDPHAASGEAAVEEAEAAAEARRELERLLPGLTPTERRVVEVWRADPAQTNQELAQRTGLSSENIGLRKHHIRRKAAKLEHE